MVRCECTHKCWNLGNPGCPRSEAERERDAERAEVARLTAWKQRAIDLKASSALVAFVSTYYDKHTPEAWDALCKLSDEFKAALAEEE